MAKAMDALAVGIARLYQSEDLSDCTVTCGPETFRLHKVVLSAHSEWFKAAFKENTFKEEETGTIDLEATDPENDDPTDACDDPGIVKLMIEYFYRLNYYCDDRETIWAERFDFPMEAIFGVVGGVFMVQHAKLFAMATKYQVPALQEQAAERFKNSLSIAYDHGDLAHAICIAYTSTPEDVTELREIVLQTFEDHGTQLLRRPEIKEVVLAIPALAYGLAMRRFFSPICLDNHTCGPKVAKRCDECNEDVKICGQCVAQGIEQRCPSCKGLYF